MQPVEINAGSWYLRALRDDDRISDRGALAFGGIVDPAYVDQRLAQWHDETHFSWAVCEPTTGELVAEVGLSPAGEVSGWARDGFDAALHEGQAAVARFAAAML